MWRGLLGILDGLFECIIYDEWVTLTRVQMSKLLVPQQSKPLKCDTIHIYEAIPVLAKFLQGCGNPEWNESTRKLLLISLRCILRFE